MKPFTPKNPAYNIPVWKRPPPVRAKTPEFGAKPKPRKILAGRGKPPFKKLQSFIVTATIMSYAVDKLTGEILFSLLNSNTQYYWKKHTKMLLSYLMPYKGLLEFGNSTVDWTDEYPEDSNLNQVPAKARIRTIQLTNSNVKKDIRDFLVGIKVQFSKGFETHSFDVKDQYESSSLEHSTCEIDPGTDIRRIIMI